jgi:CheY-like chemotaxis protein
VTHQEPCSRRVLVVEDDIDIRGAVVEVLEDAEYEPVVAGNGAEALARLREGSPDPCLILLDMMMPVMDGYEFREAQKADPAMSEIPVVLFTAHPNVTPASVGAAGVLKKPLDFDALLHLIEEFCGPAH